MATRQIQACKWTGTVLAVLLLSAAIGRWNAFCRPHGRQLRRYPGGCHPVPAADADSSRWSFMPRSGPKAGSTGLPGPSSGGPAASSLLLPVSPCASDPSRRDLPPDRLPGSSPKAYFLLHGLLVEVGSAGAPVPAALRLRPLQPGALPRIRRGQVVGSSSWLPLAEVGAAYPAPAFHLPGPVGRHVSQIPPPHQEPDGFSFEKLVNFVTTQEHNLALLPWRAAPRTF